MEFIFTYKLFNKNWRYQLLPALFLLCLVNNNSAQNLVTNGDFENYTSCPTNYAQVTRATGWLQPTPGTPDYFHTCSVSLNPYNNLAGGEQPYSGNGFAGIVLSNGTGAYREYIETQLTKTLIANRIYYFEMFVSLGDSCNYASNKFGIYFSNDSTYSDSTRIVSTPQVTTLNSTYFSKSGWTQISAVYRATGGERFITIGCFNATNSANLTTYVGGGSTAGAFSNMTYYFIDDVSLIDPSCDSIPLNRITSQNVTVCDNNQSFPITLFPSYPFYNYLWSDSTRNNYNTVNATGKYWVYTFTNNCPYIDTFNVINTSSPVLNLGVDTTLCSSSSFLINPTKSANVSYLWSNNSTDSVLQVNAIGNYWLKITNAAGCSVNDTININFNIIPNALGNDIDMCGNNSFPIKLSASKSFATSYTWFSNSTDSVVYVNDTGNYWVQITKGTCSIIDTINIKNTPIPTILLGNDTNFCNKGSFSLTAPNADSYKWFFSSNRTNPNFILVSNIQNKIATNPGLYLLEWKKNTCIKKDTIKLEIRNEPIANLGPDTLLCFNSSCLLNTNNSKSGVNYLWQNGDTSSQQLVSNIGTYWVKVSDHICTYYDTVNVNIESEIKINLGNDTVICNNNSFEISPTFLNATSLKWYNNAPTFKLTVNSSGNYWMVASKGYCKTRDTINVSFSTTPNVNLGADTIYCLGQVFNYRVNYPGATYLWNTNSTDSFINASTTGTYWVQVNNNGCKATDSVNVTIFPLQNLNLGNDTILCEGDTFTVNIVSPNATNYLWNTNQTSASIKPTTTGIYWGEASAINCKVRDSIYINFKQKPSVNFGLDTIICSNTNLILDSKVDSATYLWDDFSRNKTRSVNKLGFYTVKVTKNGCSAQDGIAVSIQDPPKLELGNDTSLCNGYQLNLQPNVGNINEFLWQNNSTLSYFNVTTDGTYTLRIKKDYCYVTDSIKVTYVNKENINLGNDTDYCFNNALILKPNINAATYLWQNGSWLDSLVVTEPGTYWVEINSATCNVRDSIILTQKTLPIIDLGTNKNICINDTISLNAQNTGAEYLWEDLSTNQIHKVKAPGLFYLNVKNNLGCFAIDSIQLDTFPAFKTNLGNDTFVCQGGEIKLVAENGFKSYLWQNSINNQSFTTTQPGQYFVTVKNDNDCSATDTILLYQKPKPIIKLPLTFKVCEPNFTLSPNTNFISYLWHDGSTKNNFQVKDYGTYNVTVTDSNYCQNTATTQVLNFCEGKLVMPNVFTPNNDNVNDAIVPVYKDLISIEYKIYNRWGQLVFETNEMGKGWNGRINDNAALADVYFYTITYFGNNEDTKTINGNFTLIR
ncbi:MAG: gliding motility-associated C-terminal domain-containing protein [Bacteroidia bacterium]